MKRHMMLWVMMLCCVCMATAQKTIEQWDRYEFTRQAKVEGNPFDVKFTATFQGADTTVTVQGFYAGNDTYKVRFMPMKTGKWTFVTH